MVDNTKALNNSFNCLKKNPYLIMPTVVGLLISLTLAVIFLQSTGLTDVFNSCVNTNECSALGSSLNLFLILWGSLVLCVIVLVSFYTGYLQLELLGKAVLNKALKIGHSSFLRFIGYA